MNTIHVVMWDYSDGSGMGAIKAFASEAAAQDLLAILKEHCDYKRFSIAEVPFDGMPAAGEHLPAHVRDLIAGLSVSVDVGQGVQGEERRYFGTITEVQEDAQDRLGVTLLVQDAKPNF